MHGTETKDDRSRDVQNAGATILTLGGIGAAFGVASCCGLPFMLASLGISSAWLTGIALFAAPHRSALLLSGAICLAAGALLLWRRRPAAACAPGAFFSRPAVRGAIAVGLLLGLGLLTVGFLYA